MINFFDVSFRYENKKESAIHNISFKIERGECVLFTGKSGCGKSTILNLINGIVPNHIEGELSGQIEVAGCNPSAISVQEISKHVGSVFQNPKSQFFNLDTTDELLFGLSNHNKTAEYMRKRLDDTVETLNITSLVDRNIFELSGGEKQKIACGSVYAFDPEIFILDEPSSNLDISSIEELKKVIVRLKAEGKTIVIAEHRLYYLIEIADTIYYVNDGTISAGYSPDEFVGLSDKERHNMGLREVKAPILRNDFLGQTEALNEKCLEVTDLEYAYHKKPVWKIPCLSFMSGEVTGIIGTNGTGKTTLANCLCGLFKAKGTIKNSKPLKQKERRKLFSLVMQDVNHQLFAESVLDELLLMYKKQDTERVSQAQHLADELGLAAYLKEHPLSLSGGQKQRVVIAASIMENKEYIIMDEPTSGLDYIHMRRVADLIRQIAKTRNIIIISHDVEFMNLCCDRIVEINAIAKMNL